MKIRSRSKERFKLPAAARFKGRAAIAENSRWYDRKI